MDCIVYLSLSVQFFVLMLVAGILYLPRVLCNGQLDILGIVATPVTSPTSPRITVGVSKTGALTVPDPDQDTRRYP